MNYHNITYPDMNNGDGLRVVLWLSGCSHRCFNCQNAQTWDVNSGIPFDESAKEELFRELDKDYISGLTLTGGDPLFESNLDGVLDLVTEFNKRYNFQKVDSANPCKIRVSEVENPDKIRLLLPNKTIWLYSGYDYQKVMRQLPNLATQDSYNMYKRQKIIKQCDVMVDGRYIDSQRNPSKKWAGSDNQHIINIKQSLKNGEIILWTE